MKRFSKVHVPAHTDYTVTMVRPNGERWEYYLPYVFSTVAKAQAECDRLNSNVRTCGVAEVAATERPASIGYEMKLRIP